MQVLRGLIGNVRNLIQKTLGARGLNATFCVLLLLLLTVAVGCEAQTQSDDSDPSEPPALTSTREPADTSATQTSPA